MAAPSSSESVPPDGAGEKITSYNQIISMLKRVKDAHLLLWAKFANHYGDYHNTAIIEMPEGKNYFVMDELQPKPKKQISKDTELEFFVRLHGVDISFTGAVQKVGSESDLDFYHILIPKTLDYQQRREHFRIRVGIKHDITVDLFTLSRKKITGQLVDISVSGICVRFDPIVITSIQTGQHLRNVQIALPNDRPLKCNLEIRYIRYNEVSHYTLAGGKFISLGKRDAQRIQHYVALADRQMQKLARQSDSE